MGSMSSVDRHDRGTFLVHGVTVTIGGWIWLSDCLDHFSWSCWQMRHSRSVFVPCPPHWLAGLMAFFFFSLGGYTSSGGLSTRVSSKKLLVSVVAQDPNGHNLMNNNERV